jgi:ATP-dependent exoDNAse (exonuclease V) beta subunit
VFAALDHPLLQRARQAPTCFRELPVTLKTGNNALVEGSIDLAFEENGVWRIVDFKTDAHVSSLRARYEQQMRWYAVVLATTTGKPATCHLLGL